MARMIYRDGQPFALVVGDRLVAPLGVRWRTAHSDRMGSRPCWSPCAGRAGDDQLHRWRRVECPHRWRRGRSWCPTCGAGHRLATWPTIDASRAGLRPLGA